MSLIASESADENNTACGFTSRRIRYAT
jgi:hypothetical protein